jgi:hypothetical protein
VHDRRLVVPGDDARNLHHHRIGRGDHLDLEVFRICVGRGFDRLQTVQGVVEADPVIHHCCPDPSLLSGSLLGSASP